MSGPSVVSRRRFLEAALAGGALLWADPLQLLRSTGGALAADRFTVPLPRPVELTGAAIELEARPAALQLLPSGPPTNLWTFNGSFPGPTIRRPAGARTTVTVRNQLGPDVGSLTIHHHGGHQASVHDGQPEREVIPPGGSRDYVYELLEEGAPERGALQWYHDHSHLRTGRNTWMGLLGLFIVDDGVDAQLGLPTGEHDITLVIADRRFDDANQLVDPFTAPGREVRPLTESFGSGHPPSDEVVGDVHLVNGAFEPFLDVEARRYRFRILNASNFRIYDVAFGDRPLLQVGTESGLLPAPLLRPSVPLGPGERAEVVVDLSGLEGAEVEVRSLAGDSTVPRSAPTPASLMLLRVGAGVTDPTTVPPVLRPLPSWVDDLAHVPDRVWTFSLGADGTGRPAWTVNGRAFDHHRVDARPELGSTETWMFVNAGPVAMSHYIHIHDVDWRVVSRNLAPPADAEVGLKETFRLDPGEVLLVGARFTDHLGPFMVHCHMLEHEDHGMMSTFEVVAPGAGDRPTGHHDADDPVAELVAASMPPGTADATLAVLAAVAKTHRPASLSVLDRPLPPVDEPFVCSIPRS